MNRPPTACRCGVVNCKDESHRNVGKKISDSYAVKSQRPFFKEYHCKRWRDLRDSLLTHNPLCQVIEKGVRCMRPASICHHLISPQQDYSKIYDWRNLVCICPHHHNDTEGEDPNANRSFSPT